MDDKLDLILSAIQEMRKEFAEELAEVRKEIGEIKRAQDETVRRLDLIEKQIHDAALSLSKDIKHTGEKVNVLNNRVLELEARVMGA
jgi:BMFP domain-containing protein YqiC